MRLTEISYFKASKVKYGSIILLCFVYIFLDMLIYMCYAMSYITLVIK